MDTPSILEDVSEFHTVFRHPIEATPIIPSDERCRLRMALIKEEVQELESGVSDKNILEIADALCDLQYVLAGAILEFGLANKFRDLFGEVHRSNMSKAANSEEEATATIAHYKEKQDISCYYEGIRQ